MHEAGENAIGLRGECRKRATTRTAAAEIAGVFTGSNYKLGKQGPELNEQNYTRLERDPTIIRLAGELSEYDHKVLSDRSGERDRVNERKNRKGAK